MLVSGGGSYTWFCYVRCSTHAADIATTPKQHNNTTAIFDEDLKLVLEHAHKLLGSMRGICMWRRFYKAASGCVELAQLISQAMWFAQDPLYQLPYITKRDLKNSQMKKLKMHTIDGFRVAPYDKREKALERTKEEWDELNHVLDALPNIQLSQHAEVQDEEGIYEGDLVHIKVTHFTSTSSTARWLRRATLQTHLLTYTSTHF